MMMIDEPGKEWLMWVLMLQELLPLVVAIMIIVFTIIMFWGKQR